MFPASLNSLNRGDTQWWCWGAGEDLWFLEAPLQMGKLKSSELRACPWADSSPDSYSPVMMTCFSSSHKNSLLHQITNSSSTFSVLSFFAFSMIQQMLVINPEYSLEGRMPKLQYFGHWMQRADSLEKTLMLVKTEHKRRRGWQRMRQHPWLNGHEFEQTLVDDEGQGSLACYSPWGREELNMS